ncbi:UNVERIFIED_CONTAM: ABC-type uncharacterized transport system permease subunit [Brevibacillus sp. OAP136]
MGKLYAELIRMRFLTLLAYRVNYYSGIIIYGLNIGAYYFLWSAIYGDQPNLAGLSVAQMTSYVAIAWMSRAFYFNNIDQEIAQDVRDGKVAIEMIRPYNYLSVKTAQALGEGIFRMIFFALPGDGAGQHLFAAQLSAKLGCLGAVFGQLAIGLHHQHGDQPVDRRADVLFIPQ